MGLLAHLFGCFVSVFRACLDTKLQLEEPARFHEKDLLDQISLAILFSVVTIQQKFRSLSLSLKKGNADMDLFKSNDVELPQKQKSLRNPT